MKFWNILELENVIEKNMEYHGLFYLLTKNHGICFNSEQNQWKSLFFFKCKLLQNFFLSLIKILL